MDDIDARHSVEPWMSERELNLRSNAGKYLETATAEGIIPKPNCVTAFSGGESSAVFKIDTKDGPLVVKFRDDVEGLGNEVKALKAWGGVGVTVPKVLLFRPADSIIPIPLAVMKYIDAKPLSEMHSVSELLRMGTIHGLGGTLARMHQVRGVGFGFLDTGGSLRGIYKSFREEVDASFLVKEKVEQLVKSGVLTNNDLSRAQDAIDFLNTDLDRGTKPSLTHNDYRIFNILDTTPPTIFDPDPRITHPALDVANSITMFLALGQKDVASDFLEGYRSVASLDDRVLNAALIVSTVKKLENRLKKGRVKHSKGLIRVIQNSAKSF